MCCLKEQAVLQTGRKFDEDALYKGLFKFTTSRKSNQGKALSYGIEHVNSHWIEGICSNGKRERK